MKNALNKPAVKLLLLLLLVAVTAMLFFLLRVGLSPEEEALQGHWVDINSTTTLDIEGRKLTLNDDIAPETYPFQLENNRLVSKGGGFGSLSDMDVLGDGSISAYEMILDADSHHYRFVREEDKVEALTIRDLSTDAPKRIRSREITRFNLRFNADGREGYRVRQPWDTGSISWTIEQQEDGTYQMDFSQMYPSAVGLSYHGEVSKGYVMALADIIDRQKLSEHNGYYQRNEADCEGYSLDVTYATHERLTIRADGDAAEECIIPLSPLMDHAAVMVGRELAE